MFYVNFWRFHLKNKAIFLDRDGVVNVDKGYISKIEDIVFFDDISPFLQEVKKMGFIVIIITNQSGVARGYFTIDTANQINDFVLDELNKNMKLVDSYYMCPHHPKGVVKEYSFECICRKPKTGMIDFAKTDYNIDINRSFLIGDKISDYKAGVKAGLKTILLNRKKTNHTNECLNVFADLSKTLIYIKEKSNEENNI